MKLHKLGVFVFVFCHLQSQRLQESLKKVDHIKILVWYTV